MELLKTIILAAGFGTRMKSKTSKVTHKVLGKPLVEHVIDSALHAGSNEICVVVGHGAEKVKEAVQHDVTYRLQEQQLGTGHAVMMAEDLIGEEGNVLVLFGDTPLITSETITMMIDFHEENHNSVTVLSTIVDDPTGYGRIIRGRNGAFLKSVEHKDATDEEKQVQEINSGMYVFRAKDLKYALTKLTNDNAQGEYYLPDTLEILLAEGMRVDAVVTGNYKEILGINDRVQLHLATSIMRERINEKHMREGITIISSEQTFIGPDVTIGNDTIIYPGTQIEGKVTIGEDCVIGPNTKIIDCQIGAGVTIDQSTALSSSIGDGTTVGPFAYIRPKSQLGKKVKIGDFVEIKNATMGDGSKASHLTYIGDADVGKNVNFGCGTVVVNYDGQNKHRSIIEDNAFIGCNTNLVSPVKVEENAYTAAGSTITIDVPKDALAVARAKQRNVEKWVLRNQKNS